MRIVAILACLSVVSPAIVLADSPPSNAASAQSSSTSASKPAAASADAQALTDDEKRLLSEGYKLRIMDGEKRFCRRESVLGSNLEKTVCTTADRVARSRENARYMTERMQSNQANPNGK